MRRPFGRLLASLLLAQAVAFAAEALAPADFDALAKALEKPLALIQGQKPTFTVTLTARTGSGGPAEQAELRLIRAEGGRFALTLKSSLASFELVREANATSLVVPAKKVAVVGEGPLPPGSELSLDRLLGDAVGGWPLAATMAGVLRAAEPGAVALLLQAAVGLERMPDDPAGKRGPAFLLKRSIAKGALSLELSPDGATLQQVAWHGEGGETKVAIAIGDAATLPAAATDGLKVVSAPRAELDALLGRAVARGVGILYYNQEPVRPRDEVRKAGAGRLVVRKGHRLAMLQGSPYEIGFQHGKLLAEEARRVSEAVLCVVGLGYTIEKGEWFPDAMRRAWARLEPHIPPEYLEEMKGLADGSGLPLETVRLANVFPELFHCSGFALFGKATAGGKLYHGRVLDYMTEIGLQRDAAVFVVHRTGAIPFANVGYAGFIGSVSGINAEKIALGEMGGRGEGRWDGTPMAILMRMGLERAKSLDDACRIFREAKRTCEYYYVFSDGNKPDAVGVAATPDQIVFIRPGEVLPKLPAPFEDAVLMSAGDRYLRLVEKVRAKYGRIDADAALDLMRRPVAMRSNLHNVLFEPQELVFRVADARGRAPACDQPYARYDLRAILADMAKPSEAR